MGDKLRLEWREVEGEWHATVPGLNIQIVVWVSTISRAWIWEATIGTLRVCHLGRTEPGCATAWIAMAAAEAAAFKLLCEAVAAFRVEPTTEIAVCYQPDDGPWRTGCAWDRFAAIEPDLSISLGAALIAAGVAAHEKHGGGR